MMDIYEKQQRANILAFHTAKREYEKKREVLEKVCRAFDGTDVNWALSMSSSLFFRGIVDDFDDFDILIGIEDIKRFEKIFECAGGKIDHHTKQKAAFTSPYYKEALFAGIHFDLVGNITVSTFGKNYCYVLKKEHVQFISLDMNMFAPVSPVEANFLLYAMMVGWQERRLFKKNHCYDYLKVNGVFYEDIFKDILTDSNADKIVTSEIIENIRELLGDD